MSIPTAICFFVPLLLYLLFLTTALIQCNIVYPLIPHHTSNYITITLDITMCLKNVLLFIIKYYYYNYNII